MNASWFGVPAGAAAGAIAAVVTLVLSGMRPWRSRPARPGLVVAGQLREPEPAPWQGPDRWAREVRRCEQAVARACRAADSVSSASARECLLMVVHRMEAELPSVEALAELGRGLAAQPDPPERTARALQRVRANLSDAVAAFGAIAERLLELVVELVARPDLARLHREVAVVRENFPLLRPMSEVLGGAPEPRRPREPVPAP